MVDSFVPGRRTSRRRRGLDLSTGAGGGGSYLLSDGIEAIISKSSHMIGGFSKTAEPIVELKSARSLPSASEGSNVLRGGGAPRRKLDRSSAADKAGGPGGSEAEERVSGGVASTGKISLKPNPNPPSKLSLKSRKDAEEDRRKRRASADEHDSASEGRGGKVVLKRNPKKVARTASSSSGGGEGPPSTNAGSGKLILKPATAASPGFEDPVEEEELPEHEGPRGGRQRRDKDKRKAKR